MKSLKKGSLLIASLAILFIMVGCGNQEATKDSTKLQIVTSFYPMYDFTQNVAGDNAEVSVLMKAGTEPHDYEPSAKDIAKIADSDVFVYNSKEMETWVSSVLTNIDTKKTVVVDASQGIDLLEGNHSDDETEAEHEGHSHAHDPHIWLDPVLAQKQVDTIKEGIIKADTKNKETYEKNALAYKEKLAALNEKFEMGLKNAENRTFVTQHAAFAYLANRYDLEQVAIAGLSPDQVAFRISQDGLQFVGAGDLPDAGFRLRGFDLGLISCRVNDSPLDVQPLSVVVLPFEAEDFFKSHSGVAEQGEHELFGSLHIRESFPKGFDLLLRYGSVMDRVPSADLKLF